MYKVRTLAFDRTNIGFDDGCVVEFRDGFGLVPDHHILTFQISSSYSILTRADEQPAATPTVSEPIVTRAEPVEESVETPAAATAAEEGDGKDA